MSFIVLRDSLARGGVPALPSGVDLTVHELPRRRAHDWVSAIERLINRLLPTLVHARIVCASVSVSAVT